MGNELEKQIKITGGSSSGWDAKRVAGIFTGSAIAIAILYFLLPILATIVWSGIAVAIGSVILGFIAMVLLNPKTRRGLRYLSEALASLLLGWAIEMNPWNILQFKIDEAKKDREQLRKQGALLKGQKDSLGEQLSTNEIEMKTAARACQIAQEHLRTNPNDADTAESLELKSAEFQNAKSFIEGVKPILNDITGLVLFADKAYRKSGIALQTAEMTLKKQRSLYDAVSVGSATMAKAMKAFRGDAGLNSDADQALKLLKDDISNKIGLIQSSIQITSQIMNKKDLEDAAKVSLSAELAAKFDDNAFDYADTINDTRVVGSSVTGVNKYLNLLTQKETKK